MLKPLKLALYCMLTACGSAQSETPAAKIFKSTDSQQCTGGGTSREDMSHQLTDAGITVLSSACGKDGRIYPAVCGAADGRINIFEIPAGQVDKATQLSFRLLSSTPDAIESPCK